jgi:Anti-sigma-K factor rskA
VSRDDDEVDQLDRDDDLIDLLAEVLDVAPPQPPAQRVATIRARADAARREAARPGRRHSVVLAVAAATVGVLGGLVVGVVLDDDGSGPTASGVVEYDGTLAGPAGEAVDATLTVVQTGIGRVVEIDTRELPILPAGEFYEVWFVAPVAEEGAAPRISAGTFHPDPGGRSHVRLAAAVDPARYPVVEITAEPGDGDPAAAGPVVMRTTIRS